MLTQCWRLEVGTQGVGIAMVPLMAIRKDPSLPLVNSHWLPMTLRVSGLVDPSSNLCLCIHMAVSLWVSLSVFKLSSYKDTSHWIRALFFTYYMWKDPFTKKVPFTSTRDMNFEGI